MAEENEQGGGGDAVGEDNGSSGALLGGGEHGGQGGQQNGGWAAALAEDVRGHPSIQDFTGKDLSDFVRHYIATEELVGRKGVIVPGADAGEAEWAKVYDALGRPSSADEYAFALPEDREATDVDKAFHAALRPAVHKAGLTQAQLSILNEGWNQFAVQNEADAAAKAAAAAEEGRAELRREFGSDADAKIERANDALKQFLPAAKADRSAVLDQFDNLVSAPDVVRFLAAVGEAMSEAGAMPSGGGGSQTAATAKAEIARMEKDPEQQKILYDQNHPEHGALVERRRQLYNAANAAGGAR